MFPSRLLLYSQVSGLRASRSDRYDGEMTNSGRSPNVEVSGRAQFTLEVGVGEVGLDGTPVVHPVEPSQAHGCAFSVGPSGLATLRGVWS